MVSPRVMAEGRFRLMVRNGVRACVWSMESLTLDSGIKMEQQHHLVLEVKLAAILLF